MLGNVSERHLYTLELLRIKNLSKRCTSEIGESGKCINFKVHLSSIQCMKCEIYELDWRIITYHSRTLSKVVDTVKERTFNVSGGDQMGPQDQKEHHESSDLCGWCSHFCAYRKGIRGDCHGLCLRWPESVACRIFWARGYLYCRIAPRLLTGNGKPRSKIFLSRPTSCDTN